MSGGNVLEHPISFIWWSGPEGEDWPESGLVPPLGADVEVRASGRLAWRGEVSEELRAWARWCALQVAHLWDCPPEVRAWLAHGRRRRAASSALEGVYLNLGPDADMSAAYAAAFWAGPTPIKPLPLKLYHVNQSWTAVGHALRLELGRQDAGRAIGRAKAHLRRLILRRALPDRLWPLIESDERVLADALLEVASV